MKQPIITGDNQPSNPAIKKLLSKQFGSDIIETMGQDNSFNDYYTSLKKIKNAKTVIKLAINPLQNMAAYIDTLVIIIENILSAHKDSSKLDALLKTLDITDTSEIVQLLQQTTDAKSFIQTLLKYYKSPTKDIQNINTIIQEIAPHVSLQYGVGTDIDGETPSLISFLKSLKAEIIDYNKTVTSLPILGDNSAILKVQFADWLTEQKKNGYIKLPYYQHLLEEMEALSRPGKVGKVVLKGHAGTGKTSIFTYKGEIEQRPYRIVSMHQYINFYELMIQNTNLSPTKNQLEFFKEVLTDYQGLKGEELVNRLQELFKVNKQTFPEHYTLIDFINTVFDINRFIKGEGKVNQGLSATDIDNPEKIKSHIITMLNYWKDEKIYKLLLSKKEIVYGAILEAIKNGENVVLDEVDKVQEKEIEGLLAFLDLNTGKYHQIQGMEDKMFIPEWFGIYATSNDRYKPAGPLGRRFNSIELEYLDKENLACYIAARITNINNKKLTTPFTDNDIGQIIKAIDIIQTYQNDSGYNALDFSVRMIDTFINNFVSYRNRIVEKRENYDPENYIIYALIDAFDAQTQDVYNATTQGTGLADQKTSIRNHIKGLLVEKESKYISKGRKLNTSSAGKVNQHINSLGYNNALVNLIITEQQTHDGIEKRLVHFPEQTGKIITAIDNSLASKKELTTGKNTVNMNPADSFSIRKEDMEVIYEKDSHHLTITTFKNTPTPKIERLLCSDLFKNSGNSRFAVFSSTGDKLITIDHNHTTSIEKLKDVLTNKNSMYHKDSTVDKVFFDKDNTMYRVSTDKKGVITLHNEDSDSLIMPNKEFETYGNGRMFISYNTKECLIGGLFALEGEDSQYVFQDEISALNPFISFSLSDIGYPEAEIVSVRFDVNDRYILIEAKEKDKTYTLPIKI